MAENPEVVKLEIPGSAAFVAVARKAVEGIASHMPLNNQQIEDLKLAVGEACTNAVKFCIPIETPIKVLFRIETDRLEIEVRNKGNSFHYNSKCPPKPSVKKLPDGGLGLYLIDQVMDELNISLDCDETVVKMVKRFST